MANNAGYCLIDTAGTYCNETDIKEFIEENKINRDSLFLSSKVNSYQLRGSIRKLYTNSTGLGTPKMI